MSITLLIYFIYSYIILVKLYYSYEKILPYEALFIWDVKSHMLLECNSIGLYLKLSLEL